MGEIYCLYATSDAQPRYVGQTEGAADKRFKKHVTSALELTDGALYEWMRKVWRKDHDVGFHVLQTGIVPADLAFYEQYWMSQFPKLLNDSDNSVRCDALTDIGRQIVVAIKSKLVMTADVAEGAARGSSGRRSDV
jgi:hypothetical protein